MTGVDRVPMVQPDETYCNFKLGVKVGDEQGEKKRRNNKAVYREKGN